MLKYLLLIFLSFLTTESIANNKENIINNLKNTNNISFEFEQNINQKIVETSGYDDYAESCLRSKQEGKVCGNCWKCFRKNSLKGKEVVIQGEIEIFLQKRPLKQAISTLYAIQRLPKAQQDLIKKKYPGLVLLLGDDYSMIERYFPLFVEIIPELYRSKILEKIRAIAEPMTKEECSRLLSMNLFNL